jgi:peptidyl-prolyl isomerase D
MECLRSINLLPESIRYLDVHPVMPEDTPPELKESFDALLISLLLNSALAAIRVQPLSSDNATIAVNNTSRALENLNLSNSDKGMFYSVFSIFDTQHTLF